MRCAQISESVNEVSLNTPIGLLELKANRHGVTSIEFVGGENLNAQDGRDNVNPHLSLLKKELCDYFSGKLTRFSCSISPAGTEFQKRVWSTLLKIPLGTTKSYGQIASEIGLPKASRAVGGASNRNPIPIVIPCHRVVGANASLVGFAGGLWRKQWMLEHEGIALPLG